jgi:hypothetical protein
VVSIGRAIFADPQNENEETTMNWNTILAVAIALFAGMAMGAAVRSPSGATPVVSTLAYGGPNAYFPDQFVNRAKEIEPMPEMYY